MTTDGGVSWKKKSVHATSTPINVIQFTTPDVGWACDSRGAILHSTNGGEDWVATDTASNSVYILQFVSPQVGFYVDWYGTAFRTVNGGDSWNPVSPVLVGTPVYLKGLFADDSTGWLVGAAGSLVRTKNGGSTWEALVTGITSYCYGLCFLDSKRGWMSGAQSTLLRTTDGGDSWNPITTSLSGTLYSVVFVNDSIGWVAGGNGALIKTTNGGTTWSPQTTGLSSGTISALQFQDENTGWAAPTFTSQGSLLRTTDGGSHWEFEDVGVPITVNAMQLDAQGHGWIAGSDGSILSNTGSVTSVAGGAGDPRPSAFRLEQNYPNPFNPTTVISYQLSAVSDVRLVVFDILGREVAVLVNERQGPGAHSVKFDASGLASGVYLYRLTTPAFSQTKKLLLVR
jgi:photosystem II stability/assembly factor-like uncharacterized protein